MAYTTDMSPETEALRHQLADRLDVHPVSLWSPSLLKAVTALLEVELGGGLGEAAPVLKLVRPDDISQLYSD
ncbi:hypothetical protein [Mycolicibacterium sp. 120270]|uniref:hypothetical protein n=1 Tax=Mycolicibacterium sp. 120270 TaxID=3090600 RepID=UPI00299D6756|nr:hypothetical protein [Mycolicibacterium sp. 120270]MDX1883040.1 hypothetical protein [Mycolicibacterium sp. 120270]